MRRNVYAYTQHSLWNLVIDFLLFKGENNLHVRAWLIKLLHGYLQSHNQSL